MGTTLVLGASPDPSRYAHLAVRRLLAAGHAVIAVGKHLGRIGEIEIRSAIPPAIAVDTITLYLSPANQRMWHDAIMNLRPRRVIFNPGAEDGAFGRRLEEAGIEAIDACTLVMIAAGTY